MKKKIFITGGHITPAIAIIEELGTRADIDIVFIGRKYALEGDTLPSAEYELITAKHIRFLVITTGRLQRSFTGQTILSLLKIPVGFVQSFIYCLRERPALVVSFGGYIALPVAVAAWVLRIPVITHEQTLVAGLANKLIARVAQRVCVTFKETLEHFPKGKAVYTGLPLRIELFSRAPKAPYDINDTYPLLYITGGATGAQSLNRLVFPVIAKLLKTFTVVHQVGSSSLKEAQNIHELLPIADQKRYIVKSYIPLSELSWILAHAKIVAGRSGANTVVELAALGKVAIFIPLPWSAGNEQYRNALWLAQHGAAMVVEQKTLTPQLFGDSIISLWKMYDREQKRASSFAKNIPRDGAKRFVHQIDSLL